MGVEELSEQEIDFILDYMGRAYEECPDNLAWFKEIPNFYKNSAYREASQKICSYVMGLNRRPSTLIWHIDGFLKEKIKSDVFGLPYS